MSWMTILLWFNLFSCLSKSRDDIKVMNILSMRRLVDNFFNWRGRLVVDNF